MPEPHSKTNNKWHDWNSQNHDEYLITCDDEYEEWYGPFDALDDMNEGSRRQFKLEGFDSFEAGAIDEIFEKYYDYMVANPFMSNEQYAVGYLRVSGKSDKTMPETAGHYNAAVRRVYYDKENIDQELALQRYVRENGYVKFHSFPEFQSSDPTSDDPFFWLKFVISLCASKGATLIYCELGSIFQHPEFFSLIRRARKKGVNVIAVKSLAAVESAKRQIGKRKIFPKKGASKIAKEKARAITLERYPIFAWKEKNRVPTKRFNSYEYLFGGADPIYKFFMSVRTKDQRDPSVWKLINDYDRNIANALHDARYRTVEGYGWNKQLAYKARLMISSDEFKDYCKVKFMIEEYGDSLLFIRWVL